MTNPVSHHQGEKFGLLCISPSWQLWLRWGFGESVLDRHKHRERGAAARGLINVALSTFLVKSGASRSSQKLCLLSLPCLPPDIWLCPGSWSWASWEKSHHSCGSESALLKSLVKPAHNWSSPVRPGPRFFCWYFFPLTGLMAFSSWISCYLSF